MFVNLDNDKTLNEGIKRKLFYLLFLLTSLFLLSFAVLLLWNFVLIKIVSLNSINYWQALGLLILCRLLFGDFRFGEFWFKQRGREPHLFKDKLMSMDEADRAAFKEEWRKRYERKKWLVIKRKI